MGCPTISVRRIDWDLLRKQKQELLKAIDNCDQQVTNTPETKQALEGILALLDELQDLAAEEMGEEAVFSPPSEE